MRYFKYLSDQIYADIVLDSVYINSNVVYTVSIRPMGASDSEWTVVYNGSIYYTGKTKVYVNDIIEPYMNDYKWISNIEDSTDFTADNIKYTFIEVKLTITNTEIVISDILSAYINPTMTRKEAFDVDNGTINGLYDYGTGVIPRIPSKMPDFRLPVRLLCSDNTVTLGYYTDGNVDATDIRTIQTDTTVVPLDITESDTAVCQNENIILYVATDKGSSPIAVVDTEPAEYYLTWINRYGATQCQPFCKKNTLKETVTSSYITSMTDRSTPFNRLVDYTWTLNSHWLTYPEHDEFESLLTSKYVWIYDTKTKQYHSVNVVDSNWEYKNSLNNNKLFNLTVNVTKSTKQNINY